MLIIIYYQLSLSIENPRQKLNFSENNFGYAASNAFSITCAINVFSCLAIFFRVFKFSAVIFNKYRLFFVDVPLTAFLFPLGAGTARITSRLLQIFFCLPLIIGIPPFKDLRTFRRLLPLIPRHSIITFFKNWRLLTAPTSNTAAMIIRTTCTSPPKANRDKTNMRFYPNWVTGIPNEKRKYQNDKQGGVGHPEVPSKLPCMPISTHPIRTIIG